MMEEGLSFTKTGKPNVEVLEAYLPLGASLHEKRLVRQSMGKVIADKIAELDAYEMVPVQGAVGGWALRCRLIIHFGGVAPKPAEG